MAVSKTTKPRKVAPTTKKLYRELAKGKEMTQGEIATMLWKVKNKGEDNTTCPASYWHGSLMGHVKSRRIQKVRRSGRVVYRLNKSGMKYAQTKGIVKV
jgi:hypothetical protein